MKEKQLFRIMAAGFLSGIAILAVLYLLIARPFHYFSEREGQGELYKNVDYMTSFFTENNDDFKRLELFFNENREWDFTFYQFESSLSSEQRFSYHYRTIYENEPNLFFDSYSYLEEDKLSEQSVNLKYFLDFSAGKSEILSVILHGDNDVFDPHKEYKRYIEVRCHEGEEIVSYLYAPFNQLRKGDWEQLIELENGWYFGTYQYVPIKLKDVE